MDFEKIDIETIKERIRNYIEYEGLDYALTSYTSPEHEGLNSRDELYHLWQQYISARNKITDYLGIEA